MNLRYTAVIILTMTCTFSAQAKMYKWVDENGQMHFGDSIPMQYRAKKHMELNEKGDLVKTHDALATEDERLEKERLEALKKDEDDRQAAQKQKDRSLLEVYSTEQELMASRDARLEALDSQLQLSDSIIQDTQRKLDATKKQIASIKSGGNAVPDNIVKKLVREQQQLTNYKEAARGYLTKKDEVNVLFGDYINRFRELKGTQAESNVLTKGAKSH